MKRRLARALHALRAARIRREALHRADGYAADALLAIEHRCPGTARRHYRCALRYDRLSRTGNPYREVAQQERGGLVLALLALGVVAVWSARILGASP